MAMRTGLANTAEFYGLLDTLGGQLYVDSQKDIPPDVRNALRAAFERETANTPRRILGTMLKAIEVADQHRMLVCQDTGIPIYWIKIGRGFAVDGVRMMDALRKGVERVTVDHPLRSSVVSPISRRNNQTSSGIGIPVFHIEFAPDIDYLDVLMMPKGSGSESMSFLKMLFPADGVAGIKKFVLDTVVDAAGKPCPPTIVGVGIGGSSDVCVTLAKKATLRPVGSRNADPEVAELEEELLRAINATGIGPMGLGGNTTALAVHVEYAWTHITLNPVAVNMQCWRGERRRARIYPDGRYEFDY
ncbi:MAG TPA: fumarate hydratase [Chloroflexota bacterium]|nr:fumarate hydratase [Chloroflexota bacterium]